MDQFADEIIKDLNLDVAECCPHCIFNTFTTDEANETGQCILNDDGSFTCYFEDTDDNEHLYNTFLEQCYLYGGIKLYDKWRTKLSLPVNTIIIYNGDNTKDTFEEIYNYLKSNNINIEDDFNKLTRLTFSEIQFLVSKGWDINRLYLFNPCSNYWMSVPYYRITFTNISNQTDYERIVNMLEQFISIGYNPHIENILRGLSGVQYVDRPHRINFIKYLIDKKYITTENCVLFDNVMLYDTRVGKCILELIKKQ
jgi:hypothetical protein